MKDLDSIIFSEKDLLPENDPVQKEITFQYNSTFFFSTLKENERISKLSSFTHPNKIKKNG